MKHFFSRTYLVIALLGVSCLATYSPVLAQKEPDKKTIESIQSLLPGMELKPGKDGSIASVDFSKCTKDWSAAISALSELPTLTSVTASGPNATPDKIASLKRLPSLKILKIDQSLASDETIESIAQFAALEELTADRCQLSNAALKSLANVKTLKRIRLPRTAISDEGLSYLEKCPS